MNIKVGCRTCTLAGKSRSKNLFHFATSLYSAQFFNLQKPKIYLTTDIQSVTKIYIYLFLKYVFFEDISGTTWAIKKFCISICILVWRVFRWKKNFWNMVTKSANFFQKRCFSRKSKLLEKIRHSEKFKNFFSWI